MRRPEAANRRRVHHHLWSGARSMAPLLAPFLVSVVFILCYCGANICRGLACIARADLKLASGPGDPARARRQGRRTFYPYELGEQIGRVIRRNCGDCPRWWSLDFWVNPDAQDRVTVKNLPVVRDPRRHRPALQEREGPRPRRPGDRPGRPDRRRRAPGAEPGRARPDPGARPPLQVGLLRLRPPGRRLQDRSASCAAAPSGRTSASRAAARDTSPSACSSTTGSSAGTSTPTGRPTGSPGR